MSAYTLRVASKDIHLGARVVGEGPTTLVLIHGGPGLTRHYIEPLEALASPGMRVVSYDHRGMGESAPAQQVAQGLSEHAADLEAIRAELGVNQLTVLGHSWGAMVAFTYLAQYAGRVASLVLVGAASPIPGANRAAQARLAERLATHARSRRPQAVNGLDCTSGYHASLPAYFGTMPSPMPEPLRATRCDGKVFAAVTRTRVPQGLAQAARQFRGPSLVVMGDRDPLGLELAHSCVEALETSAPRLVVLAGAGHYPWFEGDECVREIRHWLASRDFEPPRRQIS